MDGAGFLKKDMDIEVKLLDPYTVCKVLQQKTCGWTVTFEIKCFHKEREQRGRQKLTRTGILLLMAIAVAKAQVPRTVAYTEEGTSRKG